MLWANPEDNERMDCGAKLIQQAAMVKSEPTSGPQNHVWIYRNLVKALSWYAPVAEKLADPQYSGWFIKFNAGGAVDLGNNTWHSPPCDPLVTPPSGGGKVTMEIEPNTNMLCGTSPCCAVLGSKNTSCPNYGATQTAELCAAACEADNNCAVRAFAPLRTHRSTTDAHVVRACEVKAAPDCPAPGVVQAFTWHAPSPPNPASYFNQCFLINKGYPLRGFAQSVHVSGVKSYGKVCSSLYHSQDQTPQSKVECTGDCHCGGVPCGEYVWDHRNASLREWLVHVRTRTKVPCGQLRVFTVILNQNSCSCKRLRKKALLPRRST